MKGTLSELHRRGTDIQRKGWTNNYLHFLINSLWRSPVADLTLTEMLQGNIDGVNTTFTTSKPYVSGKITVLLNGLKEYNFTEINETTIQMLSPPKNTMFTDVLQCIYTVKS